MAAFPDFTLPSTGGGTVSRAQLQGRPFVIYFYPKDSTSGCTQEACDFRDHLGRLSQAGVAVYGVSPDSLASHAKFQAKQALTFPLLADEQHELAEKLGVWIEKSMYGRRYMGIERSTFLVGADGVILREWRKVKVKGHVQEVLDAVAELLKKYIAHRAPEGPEGAA